MGIFQPAMLVYQRVNPPSETVGDWSMLFDMLPFLLAYLGTDSLGKRHPVRLAESTPSKSTWYLVDIKQGGLNSKRAGYHSKGTKAAIFPYDSFEDAMNTLPETNGKFAPENAWQLEYDRKFPASWDSAHLLLATTCWGSFRGSVNPTIILPWKHGKSTCFCDGGDMNSEQKTPWLFFVDRRIYTNPDDYNKPW